MNSEENQQTIEAEEEENGACQNAVNKIPKTHNQKVVAWIYVHNINNGSSCGKMSLNTSARRVTRAD